MNKTLALIAALGLVVSAPAIAAEEAVKKDEVKTEKTVAGSEEAKEAPAAGEAEEKN